MNAIVENGKNGPGLWCFPTRHPIFTTFLAGLVPGVGLIVGVILSWRHRNNPWLCVVLIIITVIMTWLWVAYFGWLGGSGSFHHGHPTKVR